MTATAAICSEMYSQRSLATVAVLKDTVRYNATGCRGLPPYPQRRLRKIRYAEGINWKHKAYRVADVSSTLYACSDRPAEDVLYSVEVTAA